MWQVPRDQGTTNGLELELLLPEHHRGGSVQTPDWPPGSGLLCTPGSHLRDDDDNEEN